MSAATIKRVIEACQAEGLPASMGEAAPRDIHRYLVVERGLSPEDATASLGRILEVILREGRPKPWAERAAEKIVKRALARLSMLKLHGHELPAGYLFTEWLASYRDLACIAVLQWFLPREDEE